MHARDEDVYEPTYDRTLFTLDVVPGRTPDPPLPQFVMNRPCYLVDLRNAPVKPQNKHRLMLHPRNNEEMHTEKSSEKYFFVEYDGHGEAWPHQESQGHHGQGHVKPPAWGQIPLGDITEWRVKGVKFHPLHLHVIPYQIIDAKESPNGFYQNGDWHDTHLNPQDEITVRIQPDRFPGTHILHCHLLKHEDFGMMAWFNVVGQEGGIWAGAELIDPKCYRKASGVGYSYYGSAPPMI